MYVSFEPKTVRLSFIGKLETIINYRVARLEESYWSDVEELQYEIEIFMQKKAVEMQKLKNNI